MPARISSCSSGRRPDARPRLKVSAPLDIPPEDDGGGQVLDIVHGRDLVAQFVERIDRADLDLHHQIELAADGRNLAHGGKAGKAVEHADRGRALQRDEQEGLDLPVVELADIRAVAADDAGFFQPVHALRGRAARKTDPPGERLHRNARFPRQDAEDRPVDGVRILHGPLPVSADKMTVIINIVPAQPA
jgi:hypothetical protein